MSSPGAASWRSLNDGIFADGSDTTPGAVMVDGVTCFKDFVAVEGRANGFTKCWAMDMAPPDAKNNEAPRVRSYHEIKFATEACSAGLSTNAEYDTATLRLGYSSLVDPPSTFSYDVKERELT